MSDDREVQTVGFWRRRDKHHEREIAEMEAVPPPALPTDWRAYADEHALDDDRRELAELVAASGDFAVEPDATGGWTVNLYDDVRGFVGDPAIEALESKLRALEGVSNALHEDREIIRVEGHITGDQLAAYVIAELARTGDPDAWAEG